MVSGGKAIMNGELRSWKEASAVYFKALLQYLLCVTVKSHQTFSRDVRELNQGFLNREHVSELHNRDVGWSLSCLLNDDVCSGTCNVSYRLWKGNGSSRTKPIRLC
jgi:hypothetical protein